MLGLITLCLLKIPSIVIHFKRMRKKHTATKENYKPIINDSFQGSPSFKEVKQGF